MNILLWILQVALAWFCVFGGFYQITKVEELKKVAASARALPPGFWALSGSCSVLAGLGLLLPGLFHVLPVLTPVAAAAVAFESLVLSAIYIYYKDFSPLYYSLAMAVLGAFIAYGRFVLRPF